MNNVSERKPMIAHFIVGLLLFLIALVLIKVHNVVPYYPILLGICFWVSIIINIHTAGISFDEASGTITLRTVFYERKIPLNELEIESHLPYPRRSSFIFYTNKQKIILFYTRRNYDTILKILRIKKYKNIEQFIEEVHRTQTVICRDLE